MQGRSEPRLVNLTGLTVFSTILKQRRDWPFEDSLIGSVRWQHLGEVGKLSLRCSMYFKSIVSPILRIQASGTKDWKCLTLTPDDLRETFFASYFFNFRLSLSRDLIPKG